MLISHKYKFIFIHIQKTGGSSIEIALRKLDDNAQNEIAHHDDPNDRLVGRHRFASDIKEYVGPEIWNSYFKFAFVRNPWARLVSWYNMIATRGPHVDTINKHRLWRYVLDNSHNLETFIKNCTGIVREPYGEKRSCFFNQIDYLTDHNGNIIVDYIGQYEHLTSSFNEVIRRLTKGTTTIELPHRNRFGHRHYSRYYTDETRDIVSERFKRDIEMFGYKFKKIDQGFDMTEEVRLIRERITRKFNWHYETTRDSIKNSIKTKFPGLVPYYRKFKRTIFRPN